ncbi:MAG: DUF4351 domain-containing protein [Sandaracinaceae bacterium]|nr:DUF4351 domain-containing protein [Sandaracinaceae bacterium]
MTRVPYDQAAKALLQTALAPLGRAEVQCEVSAGEPQWVDVLFEPDGAPHDDAHGLLADMARTASLFEPFRDAPSTDDLLGCLRKQLALARGREAVPVLWIIAGGRPDALLRGMKMRPTPGWPRGVYASPSREVLPVFVVVTSELPVTRGTLLLRLMGAGTTLVRAVRETRALPENAWERRPAMAALTVLRSRIDSLDPPETELAMEINETYEQWEERVKSAARAVAIAEGLARGIAEGRVEGKAEGKAEGKGEALLRLLAQRFGPIPPQLEHRIRAASEHELDAMLDRLFTASSLEETIR